MQVLCLTLGALLLLPIASPAESAYDGHVERGTYVNAFLHFAYTWPKSMHPLDLAMLGVHPGNLDPHEFPLFALRQGDQPYGIVMLEEKLHVPVPGDAHGFRDGPDFLSRIEPGLRPQVPKILDRKHLVHPDGFIFDELDYLVDHEYTAAIIIQIGEYLVVFKCNAKTAADLGTMTRSVLAAHRIQ
jgi:hypothetical protein